MIPTLQSETHRWRGRPRHGELLLALVSLLFVQSCLSPENMIHRVALNALFFLVVLSAIRSLTGSAVRMWGTLLAGGVAYVTSWANEITGTMGLAIVSDACFALVFVILIYAVGENVFGEGPIDASRIIGAVSIYFLLGLLWAFLYTLAELIQPGSFLFPVANTESIQNTRLISEFIYFSNVTLTTLGYGDVVPLSRPAKMLAVLQAMLGQLYVAIVIARMVGLQVSQRSSDSVG
ncbi:potassium channel family protein [Rhodopirellula sp. P2]|uniref:potassium channel family protein n=1 Tax=Rhodopirellula sp. P2 TaxID=2127060 RepID=UPI0023675C22|nr:potassium channel family protein [Rhodopirellula sp. P2]WDQ17824.1 potassium channel family protein [Rhodopirellula sp. P2]